jgi:hypothetical protein
MDCVSPATTFFRHGQASPYSCYIVQSLEIVLFFNPALDPKVLEDSHHLSYGQARKRGSSA